NQVEHEMISGAIRTTARPHTPRRWSASWVNLSDSDARWLRYLYRRSGGPGPMVVIDAATRNFQRPAASLGRGRPDQWAPGSGTIAGQSDLSNLWSGGLNLAELTWRHPVWGRWPVSPGLLFSFRHNASAPTTGVAFYTRSGTYMYNVTTPNQEINVSPPAGAVWVRPYLVKAGTGTLTIPESCIRYGTTIGASWREGEHCAAMTLRNPSEAIQVLPLRDLTLDLLEM
ncbi:hypothetical protein, partial [Amycolatopsis sp. BJA-103]